MTYMLHPRGSLLAAKYQLRLQVKLVHTKLSIQGIVHCAVVDERSLGF